MFAEGWVVYPRPRGSRDPHLALGAVRFVSSGLGGPFFTLSGPGSHVDMFFKQTTSANTLASDKKRTNIS